MESTVQMRMNATERTPVIRTQTVRTHTVRTSVDVAMDSQETDNNAVMSMSVLPTRTIVTRYGVLKKGLDECCTMQYFKKCSHIFVCDFTLTSYAIELQFNFKNIFSVNRVFSSFLFQANACPV